jgi:hypothetical protein
VRCARGLEGRKGEGVVIVLLDLMMVGAAYGKVRYRDIWENQARKAAYCSQVVVSWVHMCS